MVQPSPKTPPVRVPWTGPDPASWADVSWPAWVPTALQERVATAWRDKPKLGLGGPARYRLQHDDERINAPPLGLEVRVEWPQNRRAHNCRGRYVHVEQNLGAVVLEDGQVVYVSTNQLRSPAPASAQRKHRARQLMAAALVAMTPTRRNGGGFGGGLR